MTDLFTHEPILVIQGEGKNVGTPTILIRFARCNLRCSFCDIKANWIGNIQYSIDDLINYINKLWTAKSKPNILITGGEPLISKQRQEFILELIKRLDNNIDLIEIETNGSNSLEIEELNDYVYFNISPKENRYQLYNRVSSYKLLEQFHDLDNAIVKFVFDGTEDTKEFILYTVDKYKIPSRKVYIMPEGVNLISLYKHLEYVIDFCTLYGFNVAPRLHIMLDIERYLGENEKSYSIS